MLTRENLTDNEEYKLGLLIDMINNTISTANVSQNLLTVYSNENIYTPNGSIVEFAEYGVNTLSSDDITECHNDVKNWFSTLTDNDCVFPANNAYNCHSYAWYEQEPARNNYWISYPISYIDDFSYTEVTDVRPGDIICYWAYGWNYMSGEWTVGYNITHSAIVVSGSIDLSDSTTLSNINLISKWGDYGVYTHDGDECPYGTEDSQFRYVKAYRPRTNNTYTLANYSSTINNSLIVDSNMQKIDSYEMYELDVNFTKYYEFNINSNNGNGLDVRLYDEHMQLMEILELDNDTNKVHFIKQLYDDKIYYLRVAYANEDSIGTINTKIVSRTTAYLGRGDNDILVNTYNNIDEYNFINSWGAGFYKFTIEAITSNGSSITYPNETLKIYDHNNVNQEIKYNVKGYSQDAENLLGANYLYMYLERDGYYYIHIDLPSLDYSEVILNIERVSVDEIDVASRYDEEFTETLISSNDMAEYATGFSIDQTSMFELSATTSETYSGNIILVLFRKEYNSNTNTYYRTDILGDYLSITSEELILEEGTYYVGFFGNTSNVPITVTIDRIVNTSEIIDQVLVMDPSYALPYGTEVRHNGGVLELQLLKDLQDMSISKM